MTFEEFVAGRLRTAYVTEPGVQIYVRKPLPGVRPTGIDFDLANMEAASPGQGALTRFLDHYEGRYGFFVENVLNERLAAYLVRRGYVRSPRHPNDVCLMLLRRTE